MIDPHVTWEELSVILLGLRTNLEAKAEGENSMFGKLRRRETTYRRARQDPDGMVRATLPEPKCPNCKVYRLDTVGNIQCLKTTGR
jgi:hypothetical protein